MTYGLLTVSRPLQDPEKALRYSDLGITLSLEVYCAIMQNWFFVFWSSQSQNGNNSLPVLAYQGHHDKMPWIEGLK